MLKDDFPLLSQKPIIYFDSAATTQKPRVVIEAISAFYSNDYATVHRAIYQLAATSTALYNEARATVATFINSAPEEIVFTRGTTESINLVANSIQPGDEVIISALEHHANIVPWQLRGASLKVIPVLPSGDLDLEAFMKILSPRTRLVSCSWIANSIGTKNPIKEIITLAHKQGVPVLIDAAQAAAHIPIDVKDLDADFLAFSSHKCYGPTGIGVLYGKKLSSLPPWQGGGDMIDTVTFEKTTFTAPPLCFEAGTPMIAEAIGFKAALDYIKLHPTIQSHEDDLTNYGLLALQSLPGITIVGMPKERGAIISFVAPGIHPLDLASWLDLKGVCLRTGHLCAQPALRAFGHHSVLRLSFGLYNSCAEIDLFLNHLHEGLKKHY